MKVCELLDNIFFGNGNPELLPILRQFAGDKTAEVFGIGVDSENKLRMLIKDELESNSETETSIFCGYLATNDGQKSLLGKFRESDFDNFYYRIMNHQDLLYIIFNTNLEKSAEILKEYNNGSLDLFELTRLKDATQIKMNEKI